MDRESLVYRTYAEILEKELVCAMGCTEPAALAYCAAAARAALGALPEKILVEASGNIIKNVKSVVVPNTGGRRGIAAAACAGALCGDEKAGLQVLSRVTAEDAGRLGPYMDAVPVEVRPLASEHVRTWSSPCMPDPPAPGSGSRTSTRTSSSSSGTGR